jgi:hypothetical protein
MRQILGVCLHKIPVSPKAIPLLGDMETPVPPFFFFFFLDMIIILEKDSISHREGGMA